MNQAPPHGLTTALWNPDGSSSYRRQALLLHELDLSVVAGITNISNNCEHLEGRKEMHGSHAVDRVVRHSKREPISDSLQT